MSTAIDTARAYNIPNYIIYPYFIHTLLCTARKQKHNTTHCSAWEILYTTHDFSLPNIYIEYTMYIFLSNRSSFTIVFSATTVVFVFLPYVVCFVVVHALPFFCTVHTHAPTNLFLYLLFCLMGVVECEQVWYTPFTHHTIHYTHTYLLITHHSYIAHTAAIPRCCHRCRHCRSCRSAPCPRRWRAGRPCCCW